MEEARYGDEAHQFFRTNSTNRNHGWSANQWEWDSHLCIASPINSAPTDRLLDRQFFPLQPGNSSNTSPSCSDELDLTNGKGKSQPEKKRRVITIDDGNHINEGLTLKLPGNDYPMSEREVENGGKKTKLAGGASSSRAACQVDHCGADLSNGKDYHRRHKVCEIHSKATRAQVGNVMQRFCQQCSRFHLLEEFDEGKRSCRRRLAGHNKRRRKTNPEPVSNGNTLNDDQTTGFLLINLLRLLSNMHSNSSDQPTDQNLLSHLVRSLASQGVVNDGSSVTKSDVISALLTNGQDGPRSSKQHRAGPTSPTAQHGGHGQNVQLVEIQDRNDGQTKMNNFDLNDVYIDSDDGTDVPVNMGTNSVDCPSWVQQQDSRQSSPPQTSGNSDSASAPSPSSSSGDVQNRTDRIKLKLFIQDPNEIPMDVRAQILNWLSHSPTDMESYIRPGCVILTIYLRQSEEAWEELCCDLSSSLSKLLKFSSDTFWTTGWVYVRVQHQIAFIYNGQVVVDTSLPLRSNHYSKILSIRPIAVSSSHRAQFSIQGTNLLQPATRLLCAVEGKYLEQEITNELVDVVDKKENDELQCVSFSCSIPTVTGRGFIEVEDNGFSNSSFPFIVAEEDVCSEIRVLESVFEFTDGGETENSEAQNEALDFIHEIGWLLHRTQLKSRLSRLNLEPFPLSRFKWIIEFSVDHEWCAVVNKLLNLFLDGTVDTREHSSCHLVLSEIGVLHRAVRKNSQIMVEFLLRYVAEKVSDKFETEQKDVIGGNYLFKPDVAGPAGLTPLHIAAGKDGSEAVLNALTDDPGMVGIVAWKTARDSTGFTPEDYARLRGHYSYIHLVQKKINKRPATSHVIVNIPSAMSDCTVNQKQNNKLTAVFEIGQATSAHKSCKLCDRKLAYGMATNRSLVYRPAMLSMVAVAAVCVCVALLFKSCPEVLYVFQPFRWEMLEYGTS